VGIRSTDRFWPIMVLEVHDALTMEDLAALDGVYAAAFARSERFVAWSDLRGLKEVPGPLERRRTAEWLRQIEPQMRESCLGSCNLVSSPIIRGVMTALYWIFTPPVPQAFPAREAEALAWCQERLRGAGTIDVPTIAELQGWTQQPSARSNDAA